MPIRSQVRILPEDTVIEIRQGLGLQALEKKVEAIEYDCRKADCGVCLIRILRGAENISPPTTREKDYLQAMAARADERLACQLRIFGDVDIEALPALPPE